MTKQDLYYNTRASLQWVALNKIVSIGVVTARCIITLYNEVVVLISTKFCSLFNLLVVKTDGICFIVFIHLILANKLSQQNNISLILFKAWRMVNPELMFLVTQFILHWVNVSCF